jgi:hypothetical protein
MKRAKRLLIHPDLARAETTSTAWVQTGRNWIDSQALAFDGAIAQSGNSPAGICAYV